MATSDVSGVTKYFSMAHEGFTTTLGGNILSGAATVPLASVVGLTNGDIFVGIIEPGLTTQQVFTGTVDTAGSQVTGVVWTRGANVAHSLGVTIVDYVTGTAHNMATAGILKQHTQAGAHTGITTDTMVASGTISVSGTATHSGASVLTGAVSGAGYSMATMSNPYKFLAYSSTSPTNGAGDTLVPLNSTVYDTGSNFNTGTNRFVAPIDGFYHFDAAGTYALSANNYTEVAIYKNGAKLVPGTLNYALVNGNDSQSLASITLQLVATDYIQVFINSAQANPTLVGGSSPLWTYLSGFLVSKT